ncbi:MAG: hypothetical protein HY260_19315, partial [Chloroflexi bacterium]|nr:hypothetical protein [Chloroflexota bacterium]
RANPDYIRQSIIDPGAVIAKSCPGGPCPDGVMPKNFGGRLTADQLETLVSFLASQGGPSARGGTPATQVTSAQVAAAPTQAAIAPAEPAAASPKPAPAVSPPLAGGEIAIAVLSVVIPLVVVVIAMMFVGGVGPFAKK